MCLPPLYLLLARAIMILPARKYLRESVACLVLLTALSHLVLVKQYYVTPVKADYREAVRYVLDRQATRAAVPVVGSKGGFYYDYYFAHFGSDVRVDLVAWLASDERALDAFAQTAPNRMFWYLQASPFYPDAAFLRHLETHYDIVEDRGFHRSRATLYRINTLDPSRHGVAFP